VLNPRPCAEMYAYAPEWYIRRKPRFVRQKAGKRHVQACFIQSQCSKLAT
jgi:hypothetical protein